MGADEGHEARLDNLEAEVKNLRERWHDRIVPRVQQLENRVGTMEVSMSPARQAVEHAKTALIAMLLSACAYLIKNHGL